MRVENKYTTALRDVDFLFEYEVKNREFDSLCLLAAYLELKGYTIAFVNTWESIFQKPKPYYAKVMAISACYEDGVYDYFCSHAVGFQKVVNFQWEQLDINLVYDGRDALWTHSGVALQTRHICWGKKQVDHLRQQMKIEDKFLFDCGYIPLDFYRPGIRKVLPDRMMLFKKYGLDEKKKTILFVSSFALIGLPKSEDGNRYQQEDTRDFVYTTAVESQRIILEWLGKLCQENRELQVIYRPHPAEANNPSIISMSTKFNNFFVIPSESIKCWINTCDLLYNWQSTSMIEMYASGKPTFLLRPIHIPRAFDLPYYIEGKYTEINTYDGLLQSIQSPQKDFKFPIPEGDITAMYSILDKPAYERVGEFMIQTLHDDSYFSRPAESTVFDEEDNQQNETGGVVRIKRLILNNNYFRKICHYFASKTGKTRMGQKIRKIDNRIKEIESRTQKQESRLNRSVSEDNRSTLTDAQNTANYYSQKRQQNYASDEEIRERIDEFKAILREL